MFNFNSNFEYFAIVNDKSHILTPVITVFSFDYIKMLYYFTVFHLKIQGAIYEG